MTTTNDKPHSIRAALEDYLAGLRGIDSNLSLGAAEDLGEKALADLERLLEQLEAEKKWGRNQADLLTDCATENERLKEQLEAANRVVEAARLLTRRDTFDMRIVKVREDNLMDALREYDAASSPAKRPT